MTKLRLKRVGAFSVALWQSPIYMVIGLIYGFVLGLPPLVSGQLNVLSALEYLLGMMIGYGVGGFVATAIGCILFNTANSRLGGIILEVEKADFDEPPLPPKF